MTDKVFIDSHIGLYGLIEQFIHDFITTFRMVNQTAGDIIISHIGIV